MTEDSIQQIEPELTWEQVEYVKHEKSLQWYVIFIITFIVLGIIIFFAADSIFSVVVVLLALIASLIYANKDPQQVVYQIFPDGFSVNSRNYFFKDFRSFSPITEKGLKGVIFNPLGRLQLPMNLYFAEDSADEAYKILEDSLIFEQYQPDFLQRIIDFARF